MKKGLYFFIKSLMEKTILSKIKQIKQMLFLLSKPEPEPEHNPERNPIPKSKPIFFYTLLCIFDRGELFALCECGES